jgi:hypothetical protein
MQQLLDSNLDLLITADSLYVPLRFDPSIAAELEAHPEWATSPGPGPEPPATPLRVRDGKPYVKAMSLLSLVENYETIHPEAYEELRRLAWKNIGRRRRGRKFPPTLSSAPSSLRSCPISLR